MDYQEFHNQEEWVSAIVDDIIASVANSAKPTVGLSGGKTPRPVYEALGSRIGDGSRIEWYMADERYVPFTDPESNFRMVKETLIKNNPGIGEHMHVFNTALPLFGAVTKYDDELNRSRIKGFDVLILGIGTDGHILSLFPHTDTLHENLRLTAHTTTSSLLIFDRMTVTPPVVVRSKRIIMMVSGEQKRSVVNELLLPTRSVEEFPAHLLMNHPNMTIFYLTEAKK